MRLRRREKRIRGWIAKDVSAVKKAHYKEPGISSLAQILLGGDAFSGRVL